MSGQVPSELGNLTKLTTLYLGSNQLTGSIPTELGDLTALTHLYLSVNQLTGRIPAGLREVANNDLVQVGLPFCGQTQTQVATDFNFDGKTDFVVFFRFADAYGGGGAFALQPTALAVSIRPTQPGVSTSICVNVDFLNP